jgi:hypothetical protein
MCEWRSLDGGGEERVMPWWLDAGQKRSKPLK